MSASEMTPTEAMLDGRYRLGECVGEGGMARVYRGEDTLLGRTVAIKMFRPTVDNLTNTERARSETTVLASLNHPSLVTVFDAHLVPGQPEYMVMEFISGPTLGALITRAPLPPGEVAYYAADLAEALYVAHTAGVIHRDIKPSNVLLEPPQLPGGRSRAKLADFGIARLVDTARVTSPGLVVGTAAYLAPEQVRGAEPSPPADIYSLGLVLLESLTGRPAFPDAEGIGAALARLTTSPAIPVSLGADWTHLLTQMTAADPAQRPTAAEVAVITADIAAKIRGGVTPPAQLMAATVATAAADADSNIGTLELPADPAPQAPPVAARRSGRRATAAIFASTAAVIAVSAGVWAAGIGEATAPTRTTGTLIGPAFERPLAPTAPADTEPEPADDTGIVPVESTPAEQGGDPSRPADQEANDRQQQNADEDRQKVDEEQKKAAEEEQKRLEEERKKADEEARKQAEEEQKRLEEERKEAEEEAKKAEESKG